MKTNLFSQAKKVPVLEHWGWIVYSLSGLSWRIDLTVPGLRCAKIQRFQDSRKVSQLTQKYGYTHTHTKT